MDGSRSLSLVLSPQSLHKTHLTFVTNAIATVMHMREGEREI